MLSGRSASNASIVPKPFVARCDAHAHMQVFTLTVNHSHTPHAHQGGGLSIRGARTRFSHYAFSIQSPASSQAGKPTTENRPPRRMAFGQRARRHTRQPPATSYPTTVNGRQEPTSPHQSGPAGFRNGSSHLKRGLPWRRLRCGREPLVITLFPQPPCRQATSTSHPSHGENAGLSANRRPRDWR